MKKLVLSLIGALMLTGVAVAQQQWNEHNFIVRAGFNVSNGAVEHFSTDGKLGVQAACVYEHQLFSTVPLFLETGLGLNQKGFKQEADGTSSKIKMWYLDVPVMVNYKFTVNDDWCIYPSVGVYYGIGIGGKTKLAGRKGDTFGDDGFQRSDFGLRLSCTADWKRYQVSAGYVLGLVDVLDSPEMASYWGKIKNRSFYVMVGYRF